MNYLAKEERTCKYHIRLGDLPCKVTLDLQFFLEVRLELVVDVVDNRLEAVLLVDLVAVPHRLAQGQLQEEMDKIKIFALYH